MKYPTKIKTLSHKKYAVVYHSEDDIPEVKIYNDKASAIYAMKEEAFKQFHRIAEGKITYLDDKNTVCTFERMWTCKQECFVSKNRNRIIINYDKYNDSGYECPEFYYETWDLVEIGK